MLNRAVSFLVLNLANILSKWFGKPLRQFVGFDRNVLLLKLGLTGVTVQFRNLQLLQGWNAVLLRAGLPFQIRIGLIEQVKIRIGFLSAIAVEVDGVYLAAKTTTEKFYNAEEEQKHELDRKRKRLKDFGHDGTTSSDQQPRGWLSRQLQKFLKGALHTVIKRLRVSVVNVHLRLEDNLSGGEKILVAGLAMEKLVVSQSKTSSVKFRKSVVKCIEVSHFSVYWNCSTDMELLTQHLDSPALLTKQKSFPFTDAMGYEYLLRPVSLTADLELSRARSHSVVGLEVDCPEVITVRISQDQLHLLVKLFSFIRHQNNIRHIAKFKPPEALNKANVKEWWLFAYQSVLYYLQEKRGRQIWDIMSQRSLGKEYGDLYMKFLMPTKLTRNEKKRLQSLEDEMDLLVVMVCRSKVWRELKLRRLLVDLAEYSTENGGGEREVSRTKPDKEPSLSTKLALRCNGIQFQLQDEDENQSRSILEFQGDKISAVFSQWPHFSFGVSVASLALRGCGQYNGKPGPLILQRVTHENNPPGKLLDFRLSQTVVGPSRDTGGGGRSSFRQNNMADYDIRLELEQTMFVLDTPTILELSGVIKVLLQSASSEFEKRLREHSYDLMCKGRKRMEGVLSSKELFNITADIKVPTIVLPKHSDRPSHGAVLLNPGHLTMATSSTHIKKAGMPAIQYDAKLIGTSLCLTSQDCHWEKLIVGMEDKALEEVVSCKEAFGKMIALINVLPERATIPKMEVLGSIPGVKLVLSEDIIETLVLETASYIEVTYSIKNALVPDKRDEKELFHSCSTSKADLLMDCHVMEITDQVQNHTTPVCKQAMESGLAPRSSTTLIHLAVDIFKVMVDIHAEEGSEIHSLSTELNAVATKFEQNADSLKAQLDIGRVAVESSMVGREAVAGILSTQYNENRRFLSVGMCLADPSLYLPFVREHQLTKLKMYLDLAPLDLSLSDTWLAIWTKIVVKNYTMWSTRKLKGFQSIKHSLRPSKQTSKTTKRDLQVKQYEVSKGITALSFNMYLKEVSIGYSCCESPVVRLSMCGMAAEVKDSITVLECSGSVDSVSLLDPLQNNELDNRVVYSNDLERVLKFKSKMKTPLPSLDMQKTLLPSYSRPILDPDSINVNLSADITIGGVSLNFLSGFFYSLQKCMRALQLEMMSNVQPLLAAMAVPTEKSQGDPVKYHLSVNVHTLSVMIPEGIGSEEALEVCLESALLSNKYTMVELSGDGGASYSPLGEVIQLDFHLLSINRKSEEDSYRLLRMPDANISINRIISTDIPQDALASEPHFKISFSSPKIEFDTTNLDLVAAYKTIQGCVADIQKSSTHTHSSLLKKQETESPPVASKEASTEHASSSEEDAGVFNSGARSLLQLDVDLSYIEWHATYISSDVAMKGAFRDYQDQAVTLATKLTMENLLTSLSVHADSTFSAECWLMDVVLKEVAYSTNRRRSSSYDSHRLGGGVGGESYILHQNLCYRKTKPPKFGGGTMDTRRASSKDVVLQAAVGYANQEIKVRLMMQHLHACLQSPVISRCLKIVADLQAPAPPQKPPQPSGGNGNEEHKQSTPPSPPPPPPSPPPPSSPAPSGFGLEVQLQLDHSSVALSDKPSDVVAYGMCAEVSSTISSGPAKFLFSYTSRETLLAVNPLTFSVSLVQFGHNMMKIGQVVDPCDITMTYSLKECGGGVLEEAVEVAFSKLVVSVTVEAIFSLLRPLLQITKSQRVVRKDSEIPQRSPWEVERINVEKSLKLARAPSLAGEAIKKRVETVKRNQKADLTMPEVLIYFEIIFAGSSSSVLTVSAMLEAAAKSWSSQLEVDSHIELCSYVFNRRAGAWEPLIEPIENPVQKHFKRWELNMKGRSIKAKDVASTRQSLRQLGSTSSSKSEDEQLTGLEERKLSASGALHTSVAPLLSTHEEDGRSSSTEREADNDSVFVSEAAGNTGEKMAFVLLVTSDDKLEMTLTPGAVETLYDFEKAVRQKETEMAKNLARCSFAEQVPLQIRNDTGLEITVYPGQTFAAGNPHFVNAVRLVQTRSPIMSTSSLTSATSISSLESLPGGSSQSLLPLVPSVGAESMSRVESSSSSSSLATSFLSSVTVNSNVVNLLYSTREPWRARSTKEAATGSKLSKMGKSEQQAGAGETFADGEDSGDIVEEMSDFILSSESDDTMSNEHSDSISMLRAYLDKRKKKKKHGVKAPEEDTDCVEGCESVAASRWVPKSHHHQIQVQAKGGMKSTSIAVTMPGLTFVPLYDLSFRGGGRGPSGGSAETGYGRKMMGVCEVIDENGMRVVTIRSALQIKNEFSQIISLYEQCDNGTRLIHEVDPGETYNPTVSFFASRNPLKLGVGHCGLFGEDVLDWAPMMKKKDPVYISCPSGLSLNQNRIYIQALMTTQSVVTPVGTMEKPFHLLTFKPALVIHNLLPMKVSVRLDATDCDNSEEGKCGVTVAAGKMENLFHVDPTSENKFIIEIDNYRGMKWKGFFTPDHKNTRKFYLDVKLHTYNAAGEKIDKMKCGLYSDASVPSVHHLFCPYWIVNATGLKLEYEHQVSKRFGRTSKLLDSHEVDSVTLIHFKNDMDKKDRKIKIRLQGSSHWSKAISLESAGQSENVVIKSRSLRPYELTVHDSTLMNILTRVVRIYPSIIIHNTTKVGLQVGTWSEEKQEVVPDSCVTVEPNDVKVFWPDSHKNIALRIRDVSGQWMTASAPFLLTNIGSLALATSADHELPAVNVEVNADREGSSLSVTISPYVQGSAPCRIENFSTVHSIKFRQKCSSREQVLSPGWRKLYTWEFPLQDHTLLWQVEGEPANHWIAATDRGSRIVSTAASQSEDDGQKAYGLSEVYWSVIYDGTQQVLQVFDTSVLYKRALQESRVQGVLPGVAVGGNNGDTGEGSFYAYCSLEGFGVSLLNNRPEEVLYCSIMSSPVIWLKKAKKGSRFRVLQEDYLLDAEHAWRSGSDKVDIDSENFDLKTLTGSKGSVLTRTFNPGIWLSVAISEENISLSAAVGRAQIDNQLRHYVLRNRIVFATEKVWDPDRATAPLVESAVLIRRPSSTQQVLILQNAYVKLQNLQVNVELGVLASIFPLIDAILVYDTEAHLFAYDSPSTLASSSKVFATTSGQSALIQNLSISPFKVMVTYSTINDGQEDLSAVLGNVVETLLALIPIFSHGSVTISLDSLKFQSGTGSATQLYQSIYGHYKYEILSQFYSVFLGLDVIGNPSMLFSNFELGIKDLIEETQKGFEKDHAASGVVGVAVGVKELLGHVVEGSTGSLVSATGSFRTTLLQTTDLDYKRKHRQLQHENSETLLANLSLGARFFAKGIIGGITSIFVQPIAGARKTGAEGFLKGLGRGALSVLTKPTLGVVDLAYFTLEGIRTSVDDDISEQTIRYPRLIYPDKVMRPYKLHDAQGLHILWHNEESEGTQYYTHHFLPTEDVKSPRVLLVNSNKILRLKKSSKSFKVDDLSIKLEYLQEWDAHTDANDTTYLTITYGEDRVIERIGSFFGITPGDHNAEVTKQVSIELDSASTAEVLVCKITEACEGLLLHYGTLSTLS